MQLRRKLDTNTKKTHVNCHMILNYFSTKETIFFGNVYNLKYIRSRQPPEFWLFASGDIVTYSSFCSSSI